MAAKRTNKFRVGDRVTIIKFPPDLKVETELQTKRVFELCLGKTYTIQDFDRYGHLELMVGRDVDKIVGGSKNTIWIEPEFVVLAKRKRKSK